MLTRKFIPDAPETGQVAFSQQAYALGLALVLVVGVVVLGGSPVPTALTPLGLASAVGSGSLYYAGAYWFYLGALRHVPASLAAVSFYMIPIAGLAASAIFLGERLAPHQWLGAVVVVGSILTIFWLGRRHPEPPFRVASAGEPPIFGEQSSSD